MAVGALSFFREPLDEGRAVGNLAASFRQRLALLGRHQLSEAFRLGDDEIEPAAQDHCAILGGLRSPGRKRLMRRIDGALGILGR